MSPELLQDTSQAPPVGFDPDEFMAGRQAQSQAAPQPKAFDPDEFMAQKNSGNAPPEKTQQPKIRSQEEEPEGFWSHAAGVVGNQIEGAAKTLVRPWTEGYEGYKQARESGSGVAGSIGRGALRAASAAQDPLGIQEGLQKGTEDAITGYQRRREQGYGPVYSAAAPIVAPAVGVNLPAMEDAAGRGQWKSVLAEGAVPAGEVAAGEALQQPPVRRVLGAVSAPIERAGTALVRPITDRFTVPEAPRALTQAIQPGTNIPHAAESIDIAGPRLQQLKQAGAITGEDGAPLNEFKSPADLLQGVKSAKEHVWDAIEQRTGPVAQLQADTSLVADAMDRSVSSRTERQFPDVAERIKDRADTYRDNMSLRDVENAIQDANNDLRNFYKRGSASDSPVSPEMTATEAEVRALRSLLDEKVQKLSGSGIANLKREYGALRDVERATAKANAVATRQKGATLWEGLAALRAAGDFMSGNLLGAAKGAGTLAVGRWLAKLRDPNFLIDQAFQGKKGFSPAEPIARPEPRNFNALPPGPTMVGPVPDTSGPISGLEPTQYGDTRAVRRGLLLSEPPVQARGIEDQSGVRGIDAQAVPGTRATRRGLLLPEPGATYTDVGRQAPGGPITRLRPLEMPPSGNIIDIGSQGPLTRPSSNEQAPPLRSMSRQEMDDRLEMRNLSEKIKQFRLQGDRAKTSEQIQKLRGKERDAQEQLNAFREKYTQIPASRPAVQEAITQPPVKAAERVSRTPTYDKLPDQDQEWIQGWVNEIPHLPRLLQEETMRELREFGPLGTPLKERIAMQNEAAQARGLREPGEEEPRPSGLTERERIQNEMRNRDAEYERRTRSQRPDREY